MTPELENTLIGSSVFSAPQPSEPPPLKPPAPEPPHPEPPSSPQPTPMPPEPTQPPIEPPPVPQLPPSHIEPTASSARIRRLAPRPDSPFGDSSLDEISSMPASSGAQWRKVLSLPPAATPEPVLEVKGLMKSFGRTLVVKGVDLQVGKGEIVGLLGRNGAGKTTTFRMIMGLLHPDKGTVVHENRDITRLPMYKRAERGIGYLAQQPSVFQSMSVEDNLMAILEMHEPSRKKREERLHELIVTVGLTNVTKNIAAKLSGGECRRLEIARALSLNPRIILFDEPFAGIDPIFVSEIQAILQDLRKRGIGVLLTDHNVRETLKITDRTYIMDEGKIWIKGPPREIVANPEARSRYLGHDFKYDL